MSLRDPTAGPNVVFTLAANGSTPAANVAYLGVHEMGHVLGFPHEQDRIENLDGSLCQMAVDTAGSRNGINQTAYDRVRDRRSRHIRHRRHGVAAAGPP